ncbi:hypothetical protein A0J61_02853 [Choanephora cucurbitarum]|uniref:Uncharacterized protein n=1 Tax=Choanephora cucurbitarum TaxID=101091 RepID=A0A1C7NJ08_9FUNG|nr:hypothetical protein A0J61_02853 [Choanephora cucurbitarum]
MFYPLPWRFINLMILHEPLYSNSRYTLTEDKMAIEVTPTLIGTQKQQLPRPIRIHCGHGDLLLTRQTPLAIYSVCLLHRMSSEYQ